MSLRTDLEAMHGSFLRSRKILEHEQETYPPTAVVAMVDVKSAVRHITIAMSIIQDKIDRMERQELLNRVEAEELTERGMVYE